MRSLTWLSRRLASAWALLHVWDDTDELYPTPADQSGIVEGATAYRVAGNLNGF